MKAIARLTSTALVIIIASLVAPSAASAHANVVRTSPQADAVVDTAPNRVVVTFDSALMDMGAAVVVKRDDGAIVSTGTPSTKGREVQIDVDPTAGPGRYTVAFRVASEDGHSIEGSYAYTVAGTRMGTEPSGAPTPSSGPTRGPASAMPASPEASAIATGVVQTSGHEHGGDVPWGPIIVGGVVFVALAIAGAIVQTRRRRQDAT